MSFWDDLHKMRVDKVEMEVTSQKWLRLHIKNITNPYYIAVSSDDGDSKCKIEKVIYPGPFLIKRGVPSYVETRWEEHEQPDDDYPDEYRTYIDCTYYYKYPIIGDYWFEVWLSNENAPIDYCRPYLQGYGQMAPGRFKMYREGPIRPGQIRREMWEGHWILAQ